MKVSLKWLSEYVDLRLPPEELAQKLTHAGLAVDNIHYTAASWGDEIRVGSVETVDPHPNADRLRLVTVTVGDARHRVVCGAPNVAAGQKIAFGTVGARVRDGHTGEAAVLKPAKIRGVESAGMVHQEILENMGIDSRRYTGFAAGMGVERLAMQVFGVDDIRYWYQNDLRLLRQF